MTLRTKLELHFQFELDLCYGNPKDKENAAFVRFKHNSKDLLNVAKLMYKNIQRELHASIRRLEDLNYCKVNDADIEFDDYDIALTLDVDVNEHELGAYGHNGIIFFVRKALPILRTYPKYDTIKQDGSIAPCLAMIKIIPVEK